jgi:hypothetical protein
MSIIDVQLLIRNEGRQSDRGYELPLNALFPGEPLQSIRGLTRETDGHRSRISPSDVIHSISPGRVCLLISSARSRSPYVVHQSSFPARPRPSSHLASPSICSSIPFGLSLHLISGSTSFPNQPRRPLDLVVLSALSPSQFAILILIPVSSPDRLTVTAQGTLDRHVAATRSTHRSHRIAAPLPARRYVIARLSSSPGAPATPPCCSLHSPCKRGIQSYQTGQIGCMNGDLDIVYLVNHSNEILNWDITLS